MVEQPVGVGVDDVFGGGGVFYADVVVQRFFDKRAGVGVFVAVGGFLSEKVEDCGQLLAVESFVYRHCYVCDSADDFYFWFQGVHGESLCGSGFILRGLHPLL